MPSRTYTIKDGNQYKIELSWKGLWKNMTVKCNFQPIGTFADNKELKAGKEFQLPDGSMLRVQLVSSMTKTELQVLHNGKPIPGSDSDPAQRIKVAAGIVFFVAGLNILIGLLAVMAKVKFLIRIGAGEGSIIFGVLFLILGFFILKQSGIALGLAVLLFAADGILSLILVTKYGGRPPVGAIVFRIFLLIPMIQGFPALKALKEQGRKTVH